MVNFRASQRVSQDLACALAREDRSALVALAREPDLLTDARVHELLVTP